MEKLEAMRAAGAVNRAAIQAAFGMATPGTRLSDIDAFLGDYVTQRGMEAAFLRYTNYPANACISVNDVIVHGIPGKRRLKNGDVLTIDFGTKLDGWCTDAAETRIVGTANNEDDVRLIDGSKDVLETVQVAIRDKTPIWELASAADRAAARWGLSIYPDLGGHAIGREVHENPQILHTAHVDYVSRQFMKVTHLTAGMTICIEPIVTLGKPEHRLEEDGWTLRAVDGKNSAHQEVMLLVTEDGTEVLS